MSTEQKLRPIDCRQQKCTNRHRLGFNGLGGLGLIHEWTDGYLVKGPRRTNQYQCLSAWRDSARFHSEMRIAEGLQRNPNNFAFHLFAGVSILVQPKKDRRPPVDVYIAYLRAAYSMWRHPLVLIMLARVLGLDYYNAHSLRESLGIWKELQRNSLMEIVQYLPHAQKSHIRISYQREMHWDITREIAISLMALCRNRKKMRHLKSSLNLHETLRFNVVGHGCYCGDPILCDNIEITIGQIRLLFWSGDYHSAYQSVTDLMTLCSKKRIKLDFHSARICYAVFMKLQKYTEWDHALKQQSREELRSVETLNVQQSQWASLVVDVYRTFLSVKGVHQNRSFKDLYENVALRYLEQKQSIDDRMDRCSNANDVEPFLAIFESRYKMLYNALLLGGPPSFFKLSSEGHILRYLRSDGLLNECQEPLCVGMVVHYSLLAAFAHYELQHYKLAHYFYQFCHEIDPFDPVAYQHHGLLMQNAGKMKRAEKYFERARTLNMKSKLKLESLETADVELDTRDHCAECGKKGKEFRRCGRCKVMFYCSRKCQKLNWKRGHRNQCNHYEHNELKAAYKLIPFFFRD